MSTPLSVIDAFLIANSIKRTVYAGDLQHTCMLIISNEYPLFRYTNSLNERKRIKE